MKWIKGFIFLILAGGFVLIARGGGGQKKGPPAGFVVVRYWEKWTGTEGEQMQQIVDDFNNDVGRKKHIFVEYQSTSTIDQKTLVATAAGVPPDIAGLWSQQVTQYAALDAIEPLDELAAKHGIDEQTYLPVYWNGCRYKGHLYALVSSPTAVALLYNKHVFQQCAEKLRGAGCDPDRPPKTLAELDRYAAVMDTFYANGQLDRAGYVPLQSWYVPFTSYWFGGNIFDPVTEKFQLTAEPSIAAYRWIQSYSKRLGGRVLNDFSNAHLVANFDTPQNPFLTEKLAMQQHGPWMADYIRRMRPSLSEVLVPSDRENTLARRMDNYAWAETAFPSAVPGLEDVTYCEFDALMIPVGARHKEEAFEFMAYVNRQAVTEKLNRLHCTNSPLRIVSDDFLDHHPNPYIREFQRLAASPNAHTAPMVPNWPEVYKELTDAAQAVAIQGLDPVEVLTGAQQRLQAEYDHLREIDKKRRQLAG